MALDLDALTRTAQRGEPTDAVVVTRRWLAQAAAEIAAGRGLGPTDFQPQSRPAEVRR